MSKVRIGILGAGAMGAEHAYCYGEIEGVEVASVFSRNRERAEATAAMRGAKPSTDPSALINDAGIDAIDVCVPSANHREFVIAALEHGKHVFCETPFALNLADAQAMAEAARKAKRVLMVGLLLRSAAHYEYVRRVAGSGELGRLLSVVTFRLGSYLRPGAPDHKPHYSDPSTELMTFDFDFVRWLIGQPRRLTATAVIAADAGPREISAVLDCEGGRSATVLASGIMPVSFPFSAGFRIVFELGAMELETIFEGEPPKIRFTLFPARGSRQELEIPGHNPYEKELRHFIASVRDGADPALLAPEHAIEALKLSLATQRSLLERCSVDVSATAAGA